MSFEKALKNLESQLKYTFKNKNLFLEALTHKSFCIHKFSQEKHNERLEFLGDAVLGLIIAEQLMTLFELDNEGILSKKRASLINQEVLAEKALVLNLQNILILGPGEKEQNSHLKPRLLASVYEALIGALYLEAGFEFTKKWICSEFINDIQQIKPDLEYERDYKTRLQEITQKLKLGAPEYQLLATSGPSHNPEFLVGIFLQEKEMFRSVGKSKKAAEQMAAQMLIDHLDEKSKDSTSNHNINSSELIKKGKISS